MFTIRRATETDIDSLVPLREPLHALHVATRPDVFKPMDRNVARALIERAVAHARELGIEAVELSTWAFNETAHAAFASIGFEPVFVRYELRARSLLPPRRLAESSFGCFVPSQRARLAERHRPWDAWPGVVHSTASRRGSVMRAWCALGVVLGVLAGWDAAGFADVVEPPPDECVEGTRPSVSHAGPVCWARECAGENAVETCDAPSTCQPRAYCIRDVVDYRDNHYPDAMGPCDAQGQCATTYDRCFPDENCVVTCKTVQICIEGTASGGTGGALGTAGFAGLAGAGPWVLAGSAGLGGATGVDVGGAAGADGDARPGRTGGTGPTATGGTGPGVTGGRGPTATGGSATGGAAPASGGATRATGGSAFAPTGGAATTGGAAAVPTSGGATQASGGTANPGATGGRSASAGSGTTTTGGSVAEAPEKESDDDSGCGCRLGAAQRPSWMGAALLATAVLVLGRRSKPQSRSSGRRG